MSTVPLSALSEAEHAVFDDVVNAVEAENLILIRTALDGKPAAALAITVFRDGGYDIYPVAVLVDDELFARLQDPGADLEAAEEVDPAEVRDQELADADPDVEWFDPCQAAGVHVCDPDDSCDGA